MNAAAVIARLNDHRITLQIAGEKAFLILPPHLSEEQVRKELGTALVEHRAAILAHFQPAPELDGEYTGTRCAECERNVYENDPAVVFAVCRRPMCPSWKQGMTGSPDWVAAYRNYEARRRASGQGGRGPGRTQP